MWPPANATVSDLRNLLDIIHGGGGPDDLWVVADVEAFVGRDQGFSTGPDFNPPLTVWQWGGVQSISCARTNCIFFAARGHSYRPHWVNVGRMGVPTSVSNFLRFIFAQKHPGRHTDEFLYGAAIKSFGVPVSSRTKSSPAVIAVFFCGCPKKNQYVIGLFFTLSELSPRLHKFALSWVH